MEELILDFLFTPTYDVNTIAIADSSTYPNDPPEVDSPTLEVSIPGFDTVSIPFVPNTTNVLNSTILGITTEGESPLPDGTWVFRYSVSPAESNFVEKTIFIVDNLQMKFDEAFMRLDMMKNTSTELKKQEKVSLDTIYYFIQGAIAAANNCATDEAVTLYQKADKLLYDFVNRSKCCGTNYINRFY